MYFVYLCILLTSKVLFTFADNDFMSFTLPNHNRPAAGNLSIRLDDTCVILFSSGTTGLPKAVELMHRNMVTALELSR